MPKANQTNILAQIIGLLTPLNSDERHRIVQASLTFLGEKGTKTLKAPDELGGDEDGLGLPARVRTWLKQSGLSMEQLQQVFNISEGKVEVAANEIPGSSKKENTLNAYVLAGLSKFLASGEMKFDDKSARAVCSTYGCYDKTNHATYLKGKGNLFAGTKDAGWALTQPGLKRGAELVKTLTKAEQ